MPPQASATSREARREIRGYVGILLGFLAAGLAVAVGFLLWRLTGARIVAAWLAIPLEMRITVQLSLVIGGIALAALASFRAYSDWRGRARARARAKETPPILEFSAGSVTAASLARGEIFDDAIRAELAQSRRRYLVRPKDAAARPKRIWGEPVLFVEPTRAGDTRIAPVLALANLERQKHARNLHAIQAGAGQLTALRVILGVGKGYTSLTRAHALRAELAQTPAKLRMNVIVTDKPAETATFVPIDTEPVPLDLSEVGA